MKKSNSIKLVDLKWEATQIIGPPFRVFLAGDKIIGFQFAKESNKSIKKQQKNCFFKFLKNGKMKIKLI